MLTHLWAWAPVLASDLHTCVTFLLWLTMDACSSSGLTWSIASRKLSWLPRLGWVPFFRPHQTWTQLCHSPASCRLTGRGQRLWKWIYWHWTASTSCSQARKWKHFHYANLSCQRRQRAQSIAWVEGGVIALRMKLRVIIGHGWSRSDLKPLFFTSWATQPGMLMQAGVGVGMKLPQD